MPADTSTTATTVNCTLIFLDIDPCNPAIWLKMMKASLYHHDHITSSRAPAAKSMGESIPSAFQSILVAIKKAYVALTSTLTIGKQQTSIPLKFNICRLTLIERLRKEVCTTEQRMKIRSALAVPIGYTMQVPKSSSPGYMFVPLEVQFRSLT